MPGDGVLSRQAVRIEMELGEGWSRLAEQASP